jgi:hypothetical protein
MSFPERTQNVEGQRIGKLFHIHIGDVAGRNYRVGGRIGQLEVEPH